MRLLEWLKQLNRFGDNLPPESYVSLVSEAGDSAGVLLVHTDQTRDRFLHEISLRSLDTGPVHNGAVSSIFFDQISSSAGIINATVQSGGLVQVVASPALAEGLQKGTLAIMKSGGLLTGNVVSETSRVITGQLRFAPASIAPVVAPLMVWQILHAVAGVQQLARINARLDSLQRGLERLTFRHQAKTMGQLVAAIAALEDISDQFRTLGTFTNDMLVRLALADRDIQSSFAEQRFLVQRFEQLSSRVVTNATGKQGAITANQLLKEEAPEFMIDAKILIEASKASLLSSQAWLRHDLEHNVANVPRRIRDLEIELANVQDAVEPLTLIQEVDQHAKQCVQEMGWFTRNLFSRGLVKEVRGRTLQETPKPITVDEPPLSSVIAWRGKDGHIQSVVVECEVTDVA